MKNILNLLERFSKTLNKDSLEKEKIRNTIQNFTRIRLKDEDMRLDNGILQISAGSAAKSEIRLKEEVIVRELRSINVPLSRILYK